MNKHETVQQMNERLNDELVKKEVRVYHLAHEVQKIRWTEEAPQLLEAIAIEMRSLAYQIRNLKAAKLALTVADDED